MKKRLFLLSLILVFTLTGCQDKPFESDLDGFTFEETDTLVFDYDLGNGSEELFRYTFDQELMLFVNEDRTIYSFKNINNYEVISDEIKGLIDTYTDTMKLRSVVSNDFKDVIELSLGATEDDYNFEKVTHDGEVSIEDAFIVTENGVTMIISYSKFTVDGEALYIPSYIQLFVHTIHQEVSWEFLGENNDYSDDRMKLITYDLLVVPTPMKTGVASSYDDLVTSDSEVDAFRRVVNDSTINTGIWTVCSSETTSDCINPISTTLDVQIYEMTIDDVKVFYEDHFSGQYIDGYFTFFNLNQAFVIYDMEEVEVRADSGEIIDVVNAKIRLF